MTPALRTIVLGCWQREARDLFRAMAVKPDALHARAVNDCIAALKRDGLWSSIDYLSGFGALHDAQAARINWKNPSVVGVAVNSPSFTTDRGYTFDGVSNYVDTLWNPATMSVAAANTSLSLAAWEATNLAANNDAIGIAGTVVAVANRIELRPRREVSRLSIAMNSTIVTGAAAVNDSTGLTALSRSGSTISAYKAGAFVENVAPGDITGAFASLNFYIGGANANGAASVFRPTQIRGALFGAAFTAAQHAALYADLLACLTAIGANA